MLSKQVVTPAQRLTGLQNYILSRRAPYAGRDSEFGGLLFSHKKNLKILAIETSCDETAASVVEKTQNNVRILSNVVASQIELHKKYGGIFPEHASRAHVEKIIPVVEKALVKSKSNQLSVISINKNIPITDNYILSTIDSIAVTVGPGLIGSLLIGVNFAKTLACAKNLPIIGINHLAGHIYSNWAEGSQASEMPVSSALRIGRDQGTRAKRKPMSRLARAAESELTTRGLPAFPALVLIVSGGHTGLVLMKSHKDIVSLGETLDDAAGEAFDKIAKLLDLDYPGGPAISKAAEKGNPKAYNFPRSMLEHKDFNFSFSGLKTSVLYETKKHKLTAKIKKNMAASFQQAVIDILIGKTIQAAYQYQPKSICLCGGVSANKELQKQMSEAVKKYFPSSVFRFPSSDLTTDNAAMIGIAASYHLEQKTTYDKIMADANLKL